MTQDTQLAHSIRSRLGSEAAGQWLAVMDEIAASLPFLLGSAGRPTADQIKASPIGQAGFDSWRSMVESLPANGGLGWSYETYRAWKKAYGVVLTHPYLRELTLSASEINTISREAKEWPNSVEALRGFKEVRKAQLDGQRGNNLKSLQDRVGELTEQEASLTADLRASQLLATELAVINQKRADDLAAANKKIGALERLLADASKKSATIAKRLATAEKQAATRLEKLEAIKGRSHLQRLQDFIGWPR